jgi:hypothetical protein
MAISKSNREQAGDRVATAAGSLNSRWLVASLKSLAQRWDCDAILMYLEEVETSWYGFHFGAVTASLTVFTSQGVQT